MALAVGLVFATPLGYLLYRNTVLGGDVLSLLRSPETLTPLRRSLTLAVAVALATAVLGVALAWLTTRSDVPGRRWWRAVVPLPLVIPSFVGAAALDGAVARGGPLAALPDLD
ncbi:MAG: iron ABC transporter permease, partial [Actinomycetota bacterium]|nr:iron ABC transporter permease [Actinomycetota bacterium]